MEYCSCSIKILRSISGRAELTVEFIVKVPDMISFITWTFFFFGKWEVIFQIKGLQLVTSMLTDSESSWEHSSSILKKNYLLDRSWLISEEPNMNRSTQITVCSGSQDLGLRNCCIISGQHFRFSSEFLHEGFWEQLKKRLLDPS